MLPRQTKRKIRKKKEKIVLMLQEVQALGLQLQEYEGGEGESCPLK